MEKLLTPAQVAELLGIAVQTIYNRIQAGRPLPPYVRIGRLLRFRLSDVQAWMAALPSSTARQRKRRGE